MEDEEDVPVPAVVVWVVVVVVAVVAVVAVVVGVAKVPILIMVATYRFNKLLTKRPYCFISQLQLAGWKMRCRSAKLKQ